MWEFSLVYESGFPRFLHLKTLFAFYFYLRRGRDSNPRYLAAHLISNQAHSTTLTPLRRSKLRKRKQRSKKTK